MRGAPKYIFYFIGDGMASVQIHAAEAYLAALQGKDEVAGSQKAKLLAMSHFPVQGLSTTFANNRLITGSAAAGTALACGMKTNIGVISMNPDATRPYTTVAELAKAKGMKGRHCEQRLHRSCNPLRCSTPINPVAATTTKSPWRWPTAILIILRVAGRIS